MFIVTPAEIKGFYRPFEKRTLVDTDAEAVIGLAVHRGLVVFMENFWPDLLKQDARLHNTIVGYREKNFNEAKRRDEREGYIQACLNTAHLADYLVSSDHEEAYQKAIEENGDLEFAAIITGSLNALALGIRGRGLDRIPRVVNIVYPEFA